MAVPDASDRDGEGEIDDENYRLHCVQACLIPLWNAASCNWPNRCQSVNNESGDKNGEESLTDVSSLIQISIVRDLYGVINALFGEALSIIA